MTYFEIKQREFFVITVLSLRIKNLNQTHVHKFYTSCRLKILETIITGKKRLHFDVVDPCLSVIQMPLTSLFTQWGLVLAICFSVLSMLFHSELERILCNCTVHALQVLVSLHWSYLYRDQCLLAVPVLLTSTQHSVSSFSSPKRDMLMMKNKVSSLSRNSLK